MLQVSVNYFRSSNSSSCENAYAALYGMSVNYSGNSLCEDYTCMEAFVSYPVLLMLDACKKLPFSHKF